MQLLCLLLISLAIGQTVSLKVYNVMQGVNLLLKNTKAILSNKREKIKEAKILLQDISDF